MSTIHFQGKQTDDRQPDIQSQGISISITHYIGSNAFHLETICLEFNESTEAAIELTFSNNQNPRSGEIGLDGVYRMIPGDNELPI